MMHFHEVNQTFTVSEVRAVSSAAEPTIREFMMRLSRAGFITPVATPPVQSWRVAKPQAETPRVRKDGSIIESAGAAQCMWNGMRTLFQQGFDAIDLAGYASTDEVKITLSAAQLYIKRLAAAGYLIKLQKGSSATALWRLDPARNTGPHAPMILKTQLLFDPNKGDIVGAAEAEEVLA